MVKRNRLYCDDCRVEIFTDLNMVMLRDELWEKVSGGKMKDAYCDCCIEKRLGRPIEEEDFKPSEGSRFPIPCNYFWLMEQEAKRSKVID